MKMRSLAGTAVIVILAFVAWITFRSEKQPHGDGTSSSSSRTISETSGAMQAEPAPTAPASSQPPNSAASEKPGTSPRPLSAAPAPSAAAPGPGAQAPGGIVSPQLTVAPAMTPGPSPEAPAVGEINVELITGDLDQLSLSLRDYRTLMTQNPVGTNEEITAALTGRNPKGARLAPDDSKVNGEGRLVDRWGTPYFFHQMSSTSMEIHSAGPDKKMGTDDDIIQR